MALIPTTTGLNLFRDVLTGAQANGQAYYLALGSGGATLNVNLSNGTAYTSLTVTALPAALPSGQSLTLTTVSGSNSQVITLSAPAVQGATSISVTSFTANFAYPIGAGLVNTPAATDTQLQHEFFRKAVTSFSNGGAAGEALINCYVAASDAVTQIFEFGWFAGSTATGTANSGVLLARGVYAHNKTNLESIQMQLDNTF